jgi:hypothetical protein
MPISSSRGLLYSQSRRFRHLVHTKHNWEGDRYQVDDLRLGAGCFEISFRLSQESVPAARSFFPSSGQPGLQN